MDPDAIAVRDYFEFEILRHENWDKAWDDPRIVEALAMEQNSGEKSIILCALEQPGRAVIFPEFKAGELRLTQVSDTSQNEDEIDENGDPVVVNLSLVLEDVQGNGFVLRCPEIAQFEIWKSMLEELFYGYSESSSLGQTISESHSSQSLMIEGLNIAVAEPSSAAMKAVNRLTLDYPKFSSYIESLSFSPQLGEVATMPSLADNPELQAFMYDTTIMEDEEGHLIPPSNADVEIVSVSDRPISSGSLQSETFFDSEIEDSFETVVIIPTETDAKCNFPYTNSTTSIPTSIVPEVVECPLKFSPPTPNSVYRQETEELEPNQERLCENSTSSHTSPDRALEIIHKDLHTVNESLGSIKEGQECMELDDVDVKTNLQQSRESLIPAVEIPPMFLKSEHNNLKSVSGPTSFNSSTSSFSSTQIEQLEDQAFYTSQDKQKRRGSAGSKLMLAFKSFSQKLRSKRSRESLLVEKNSPRKAPQNQPKAMITMATQSALASSSTSSLLLASSSTTTTTSSSSSSYSSSSSSSLSPTDSSPSVTERVPSMTPAMRAQRALSRISEEISFDDLEDQQDRSYVLRPQTVPEVPEMEFDFSSTETSTSLVSQRHSFTRARAVSITSRSRHSSYDRPILSEISSNETSAMLDQYLSKSRSVSDLSSIGTAVDSETRSARSISLRHSFDSKSSSSFSHQRQKPKLVTRFGSDSTLHDPTLSSSSSAASLQVFRVSAAMVSRMKSGAQSWSPVSEIPVSLTVSTSGIVTCALPISRNESSESLSTYTAAAVDDPVCTIMLNESSAVSRPTQYAVHIHQQTSGDTYLFRMRSSPVVDDFMRAVLTFTGPCEATSPISPIGPQQPRPTMVRIPPRLSIPSRPQQAQPQPIVMNQRCRLFTRNCHTAGWTQAGLAWMTASSAEGKNGDKNWLRITMYRVETTDVLIDAWLPTRCVAKAGPLGMSISDPKSGELKYLLRLRDREERDFLANKLAV